MELLFKDEKFDISKDKLLSDFLFAVCSKLGLDTDGDVLNVKDCTFVINARQGYIVKAGRIKEED